MAFSKRKEFVGIVLGILFAGMPMAAFNLWLDHFVEQQGRDEVKLVAQRSLALADARVSQVIDSLEELAGRGIATCRPAYIEAMRQMTFATSTIKELSVVDSSGHTRCTDLGISLGTRTVVSSQPLTTNGDIAIEVVRLGERKEEVARIRRASGNNNRLAALIPRELLLPQVSTAYGVSNAHTRLMTREGMLITENGRSPRRGETAQLNFAAAVQSPRYNLVASVSLPRDQVRAIYGDLNRLGTVITSVIALVIIGFALILPARRRESPIDEIARALEGGEFVPYYQPIVDIKTGRLRGAEVLIRWRKADGSIVLPGAFIPLVESSDLVVDLTRSLMQQVCGEVGPALGHRPQMYIAFNIAPRHFADSVLLNDVDSIFDGQSLRLSQIVLELTERYEIDDLSATRQTIAALQGLGCRVALDDVGTGHSGLSYILKLGVDIIKIDKLFVEAIWTERHSQAIVETLVDLARNLRMQIVAEGVENFEQVIYLREHGISAAQGYVFAPPLPGAAFLQLVEAIDPLPSEVAEPKPPDVALTATSVLSRFAAA